MRVTDPDESIALSWTPRPAELADAQLARSRELGVTSVRGVLAVLIALLGALMLTSRVTLSVAIVLFGLAFLLVWMRVTATIMRRRWGVAVAGNPALGDTVSATLDASEVRTDGERVTMTRRWSAFTSWSDTPAAVVFSTSDTAQGALLVVPHRATSGPEQLAAIRALAVQQLGPALGSGPGRSGRRWWPWVARALVLALLVVPLAYNLYKVHDETGDWRPWPNEAPSLLSYEGRDFHRVGSPAPRPEGVAGIAYTSGGGLILRSFTVSPDTPLTEIWVLDHDNVVHHYVTEGHTDSA